MHNIKTLCVGTMLAAVAATAQAGGILTNTNQSIDFLRNPSRDAAIGLDGVYSNPAGVVFMPQGLHIGLNWQYAHQTRTITSTNPLYALGAKNHGATTKEFEGVADAPCIPSIQLAYNKGDWSFQFNLSVPGGGGACEFADGLGSFETVVGDIASKFMALDGMATRLNQLSTTLAPLYALTLQRAPEAIATHGVQGYDMNSFMRGRQYYFGVQIGSAYKFSDKFSVYGGLRLLYGDATYKAKISNIQVKTANGYVAFGDFLPGVPQQAQSNADVARQHLAFIQRLESSIIPLGADQRAQLQEAKTQLTEGLQTLTASQDQLATLAKYSEGVNLLCNQTSLGIAPVIGVDFKPNKHFNFAAKYEFKTQIRMKNESTVDDASEIAAVNKFRDGETVNEDQPAQLAVGAMWSPVAPVRLNAGFHMFFDKDASWYGNTQQLLDHNSYEINAGAEWDITDRLTVSAGAQMTRYGLTDEYMNDMSFVVNSYSCGLGFNYKVSNHVKAKAGYFQTYYDNYDRVKSPTVSDSFTRTNRVLGIGCDIDI